MSEKSENKHWSKAQERGTYFGMKTLFVIYRLLGRKVLAIILYPVVVYLYFTGKEGRLASNQYLNKVAKIQSWPKKIGHKQGIKHFYTFALGAFDKIDAWTGKITTKNIIYGKEHAFDDLKEKQHGAIFIGSHLGNLEVCRALSQGRYQTRINVLVFTHHAVEFNKVMQQINPDINVDLIQVSDVGADLAILLKERIDNGEVVVIVGDRTSVSTPGRVVYADFLGEQAAFSQGPFILAALLDCPVYYLFCLKEGSKYHVIFEHVADTLKMPRKERQQKLEKVVTDYAKRLEFYCLKYPFQWFNFFDFWSDDQKVERKK